MTRRVDVLDLGWQVWLVLAAVDDRHGVAGGEQLVDQGEADEAGAAEDEGAHPRQVTRVTYRVTRSPGPA